MDPAERYEVAVAMVKSIVDQADPEGLLEAGAPADEYDSYSAEVARRLLHGDKPLEIAGGWSRWNGAQPLSWFVDRLQEAQTRLLADPEA